ncbi:hypothetical protein DFH07DRAFT_775492 [Mycena maculata]|uniref:Uncharacterized protein n=1 Tax=Mycena maculata TaxID=230809 RepID=A0AAD7N7W1_9AGAR|nr:hypothetical protein DFH07DRAFT_775492 [Mycena maculata]
MSWVLVFDLREACRTDGLVVSEPPQLRPAPLRGGTSTVIHSKPRDCVVGNYRIQPSAREILETKLGSDRLPEREDVNDFLIQQTPRVVYTPHISGWDRLGPGAHKHFFGLKPIIPPPTLFQRDATRQGSGDAGLTFQFAHFGHILEFMWFWYVEKDFARFGKATRVLGISVPVFGFHEEEEEKQGDDGPVKIKIPGHNFIDPNSSPEILSSGRGPGAVGPEGEIRNGVQPTDKVQKFRVDSVVLAKMGRKMRVALNTKEEISIDQRGPRVKHGRCGDVEKEDGWINLGARSRLQPEPKKCGGDAL